LRRLLLKHQVDDYVNRLLPENLGVTSLHALADWDNEKHIFTVGEVVLGTVLDIKPYGAYIDIGGDRGLLHISEISDQHIETPHMVLNVGDQLRVMIIDLDPISLSTKALAPGRPTSSQIPQRMFEKAEEIAARYKRMPGGEGLE